MRYFYNNEYFVKENFSIHNLFEEIFIFQKQNLLNSFFDEIKISISISEFFQILFKIKNSTAKCLNYSDKFIRIINRNDLNLSIREKQLNNFQIWMYIQIYTKEYIFNITYNKRCITKNKLIFLKSEIQKLLDTLIQIYIHLYLNNKSFE